VRLQRLLQMLDGQRILVANVDDPVTRADAVGADGHSSMMPWDCPREDCGPYTRPVPSSALQTKYLPSFDVWLASISHLRRWGSRLRAPAQTGALDFLHHPLRRTAFQHLLEGAVSVLEM